MECEFSLPMEFLTILQNPVGGIPLFSLKELKYECTVMDIYDALEIIQANNYFEIERINQEGTINEGG